MKRDRRHNDAEQGSRTIGVHGLPERLPSTPSQPLVPPAVWPPSPTVSSGYTVEGQIAMFGQLVQSLRYRGRGTVAVVALVILLAAIFAGSVWMLF